ncbi:MAG TPA: efflux RND transporter permease subunit, partial [Polyangiaceae bacterium]|nr:efflux RND transporter permease subunit [Polyangiaceae bacterium]
ERVDGVGSIGIAGGGVREIRVEVNQAKVEALGLTVAQVGQAVGAEGFDLPSGRVKEGVRELAVKASGQFQRPAEIGEIVLTALADGTQVRVLDVAEIIDGIREPRSLTRVNGVDSITFEVQKQAGTNTVAVADGVERAVQKLRDRLPSDVVVTKLIDSSSFIRNNIRDLWESLIVGGLLAVVVIFVFMLDWRSTLISAVALPTSVVASFFVMWQLGFTLNIMSMMGLSLAIGMLIDDSVVVRENIFRHMESGKDPVTAARQATSEIALAVMATTFTIVAVFAPIAFTGGLVGRFFRQFGLTVAAAVVVSLLVSFTLDPMLSARITQKILPGHHERMRTHRVFGPIVRALDTLDTWYRHVLSWSLSHGKTVIFGALLLLLGSTSLTSLMGREFFGGIDQGDFALNLELPAGRSLAETDRVTRQVESILRQVPEVVTVATTVGPREEVDKTSIRVKTTPKMERRRSLPEIMESLRAPLAGITGLVYNMRVTPPTGGSESSTSQAPITLRVHGKDHDQLRQLAQRAFEIAQSTPGVRDASLSYKPGIPERRFVVNRSRAGDLGVPYSAVAKTLRMAIEGEVVGKYRDGDHEWDVRVKLRPEDQLNVEQLGRLAIASRRGQIIHLQDVTRSEEASAPATIERLNRERLVTISANVMSRSLGEVVTDLEQKLEGIPRPVGYTFKFAGEAERMRDTFANLGLALALAIVFIYLVLASQFESFLHPFTIMLSLPLAIVGALATLFLFNQPIGMPALIGIILLMGLVTKNAILLVDYTNQLRNDGAGVREALLEAGPTRLRPILMTSAAMVLGMLPTALGRGEGSELRSPMSIAVIGGVITSTILTLVVVPVVYVWVDRLTFRGRRRQSESKVGVTVGAADSVA